MSCTVIPNIFQIPNASVVRNFNDKTKEYEASVVDIQPLPPDLRLMADHPLGWFDPAKQKGQRDRVALLSLDAQAEIERVQPCNRTDKTKPHFLSVLRDLSNIDKHRRLVLSLAQASDVTISLAGRGIPTGTVIRSDFRGPLNEHTKVAFWSFIPAIEPPDMDVQCNFEIDVKFGEDGPAPNRQILGILRQIHNYVGDTVFPTLEQMLT